MTKNPNYKNGIGFRDAGRIFYEEGLAYTVKPKIKHKVYVWVRKPELDFLGGKD